MKAEYVVIDLPYCMIVSLLLFFMSTTLAGIHSETKGDGKRSLFAVFVLSLLLAGMAGYYSGSNYHGVCR